MDKTETIRRQQVQTINSKETERVLLEKEHGQVWTTDEMSEEFEAIGFMAPYIVVRRKSDQVKGSLMFQDRPRYYFNFKPA